MISKQNYYVLVGLTAAGINKRKEANIMQDELEKYLKECGVSEDDAYTWAGELVYNEGDEAAIAVDHIVGILGLEIEK